MMGKVSAANIWRKYFLLCFTIFLSGSFVCAKKNGGNYFLFDNFFFGNTDDEFVTWLEPFCTSLKLHDPLLSSIHSDELICHFLLSFTTISNKTLLFNSLQKFLTK
jgi:hypothetical protein